MQSQIPNLSDKSKTINLTSASPRFNPDDLTMNCSYVTLAYLLNQSYQWLIDSGIATVKTGSTNTASAQEAVTALEKACKVLNDELAIYDITSTKRVTPIHSFHAAGSNIILPADSLAKCKEYAVSFGLDQVGVGYTPPAQQGGHCIIWQKASGKANGEFYDYQNNSLVDCATVAPNVLYGVTYA